MDHDKPLVYVVDDDDALRDALTLLLSSVELASESYPGAAEFLEAYEPEQHSVLLADIRMPGMSGLELQEELRQRDIAIPIIFITGHGDVPMAVEAMKLGALDFLQKPFRDQVVLDRINEALQKDAERRCAARETHVVRERLASLTAREREVMERVVAGQANKVIALDLGVSQRTVEIHRARVMQKMGVRSLAELVRVVGQVA
jgi:two-component system, LuxR family, response regulator FixJ